MGRTVEFEQSPPRRACQAISNEGAKKQGNRGGIAGYNRCHKEKQP